MLTKALYFPYIKTPEDAWFTRVLLFWDSVGTILPGNLEDDERFVTRHMRELRNEGLLENVRPVLDFEQMPRFRQSFLTYLDTDAAKVASIRRVSDRASSPVEARWAARRPRGTQPCSPRHGSRLGAVGGR